MKYEKAAKLVYQAIPSTSGFHEIFTRAFFVNVNPDFALEVLRQQGRLTPEGMKGLESESAACIPRISQMTSGLFAFNTGKSVFFYGCTPGGIKMNGMVPRKKQGTYVSPYVDLLNYDLKSGALQDSTLNAPTSEPDAAIESTLSGDGMWALVTGIFLLKECGVFDPDRRLPAYRLEETDGRVQIIAVNLP